jgi:prolipoprotein diacylglyceryltransferase
MKLFPDDWRARLTGVAGGLLASVIALFLAKPMIELPRVGAFALGGMIIVGGILGNIVGGWLFKPSSSSPPNHPPRA